MNRPHQKNQLLSRQQQAPSWGSSWRGTLQSLSVSLFNEELAAELASSEPPSIVDASSSTGSNSPIAAQPQSIVKETPVEKIEYSPTELQEKMKCLMTSFPELWKEYKQELARAESPNQPETVRKVLVDFLHRHEHDLNPSILEDKGHVRLDPMSWMAGKSPNDRPTRQKSSFLNALKDSLHGETFHCTKNSWTHQRPNPRHAATAQSSFGERQNVTEGESPVVNGTSRIVTARQLPPRLPHLERDHTQQRLARLQGLPSPDLWTAYQLELQTQENPSDSRTIQIILDEFWKEHETEIVRQEQQHHSHQQMQNSTISNQSESSSICSTSILQRFNSICHEQERHASQSDKGEFPLLPPLLLQEDTTQRRLTRLRQVPHLWVSFYGRMEQHPKSGDEEANDPSKILDLLEAFWKEHEDEVLDCEEVAMMEAKIQSSSIYLELNTSFHDEKVNRAHPYRNSSHDSITANPREKFLAPLATSEIHRDQTQQKLSRLRQIPSLWQDFQSALDQHDDPSSVETIQQVVKAVWTEHEKDVLKYEADQEAKHRQASSLIPELNTCFHDEEAASLMPHVMPLYDTDGENLVVRSARGLKWAAVSLESQRQTFSMRSSRSLHIAMEELTGELFPTGSEPKHREKAPTPAAGETRTRKKSLEIYQHGQAFSSRSMRSLKLAIDSLAGEVGGDKVGEPDEENKKGHEGQSATISVMEDGSMRRKISLARYKQQDDGFSSRSIRSIQVAIDGLAGEVGEAATSSVSGIHHNLALTSSNTKKQQLLPENAKTIWMSVNDRGCGSPKTESESRQQSSSGVLSILTSLIGSPSASSSTNDCSSNEDVKEITANFSNDIDLVAHRSSRERINGFPPKPPPGSTSMTSGLLGRLSQVTSLLGQGLESEVSEETLGWRSQSSHDTDTNKALTLEGFPAAGRGTYLRDTSDAPDPVHPSCPAIVPFDSIAANNACSAGGFDEADDDDDDDDDDDALFRDAAQIAAARRSVSEGCQIGVAAKILPEESASDVDGAMGATSDLDPMEKLLRDPMMDVTIHNDVEAEGEADREFRRDNEEKSSRGSDVEEGEGNSADMEHSDDESLL